MLGVEDQTFKNLLSFNHLQYSHCSHGEHSQGDTVNVISKTSTNKNTSVVAEIHDIPNHVSSKL